MGAHTNNDPWIFVSGRGRQLTTTAGVPDPFARARGAGGGFGLATDDSDGYSLYVSSAVGTSGMTQIHRRSTSCNDDRCTCVPNPPGVCDTPVSTNDVAIGAPREGSVYYIDPLHPTGTLSGHLLVLGEDPNITAAPGTDVTLRFAGDTGGEALGADGMGELVISSGRVGGAGGRLYDLRAVATRQAADALTVIAVAAVDISSQTVRRQRIYVSGLRVCGRR